MSASVVIPTYNESENLSTLVEKVSDSYPLEIVVVDDASPDGTGELADELSGEYNVKVVHRSGKLGLASAMLEGLKASSGEIVGFMDADLSHPPEILPKMIEPIISGEAEVVFASRYIRGGGIENWPLWRKMTSWGAGLLAKPLTSVSDPMSGLFFIKRDVVEGVELDTVGFKLGLEILVKGRYERVSEVPFVFKDRAGGKSKLDRGEYLNYIKHLLKLYAYRLGLR